MAAAAGFARGGPLTPPVGTVAPTGRTLLEVEPRIPVGPATTPGDANSVYRITQPGSYYLIGNVQGVANKHGIVIAASDVTLDLMGFDVRGTYAGSGATAGGWYGVQVPAFAGIRRATVLNGTVSNWDGAGVGLASDGSLVQSVTAVACGLLGMGAGNGSSYVDCAAVQCAMGFNISPNSTLSRCHAEASTGQGYILNQGNVLDACTAKGSGSHGFHAQSNTTFRACASYQNAGDGFQVTNKSLLYGCNAYFNVQNGINASGSTVIDCIAGSNTLSGIVASGSCMVRGNTCDGNGNGGTGYGVSVTGSRNRIEANHCTGNDQGINVSGAGNLIIRNSASGNSGFGYSIAAGNSFGPNVVPAGNQIATSTNPHSNYEF